MRKYRINGYETCAYSLKRKNAPWRATSGCDNRARLFTGRHYELPNCSVCVICPFYRCSVPPSPQRMVSMYLPSLTSHPARPMTAATSAARLWRTAAGGDDGSCKCVFLHPPECQGRCPYRHSEGGPVKSFHAQIHFHFSLSGIRSSLL